MTATPLPPHVISTDHPNHPSEGWSIAEMAWIDARDKIFQAYARQARADLEAEVQQWIGVFGHLGTADECGNEWIKLQDENQRLREALQNIKHMKTFAIDTTSSWCPLATEMVEIARAALESKP